MPSCVKRLGSPGGGGGYGGALGAATPLASSEAAGSGVSKGSV